MNKYSNQDKSIMIMRALNESKRATMNEASGNSLAVTYDYETDTYKTNKFNHKGSTSPTSILSEISCNKYNNTLMFTINDISDASVVDKIIDGLKSDKLLVKGKVDPSLVSKTESKVEVLFKKLVPNGTVDLGYDE